MRVAGWPVAPPKQASASGALGVWYTLHAGDPGCMLPRMPAPGCVAKPLALASWYIAAVAALGVRAGEPGSCAIPGNMVNALTPARCAGVLRRRLLGRPTVEVRLGVAGRLLNNCCCCWLLPAILLSGLLLGPARSWRT